MSEKAKPQPEKKVDAPAKLDVEELQMLPTSELLDLAHSDRLNEIIDTNAFWKVILDRRPFWFFNSMCNDLAKFHNDQTDRYERMEDELHGKVDMLESVVQLLIEMVGESKVELDIKTVLELAGFGRLCP